MSEFSKLTITQKGQSLIAKLLAGATTSFTKISTSSASYDESELETLEKLDDIEQTEAITMLEREDDTQVTVSVSFTNTGLSEGYYMRTLGLYAVDPDEGEILYAAAIETSGNCYMPPYSSVTATGAYIQLIITVGNADQVNLSADPSAIDVDVIIEKVTEVTDEYVDKVTADIKVDVQTAMEHADSAQSAADSAQSAAEAAQAAAEKAQSTASEAQSTANSASGTAADAQSAAEAAQKAAEAAQATADDVSSQLGNYVSLTGTETISGSKTFSAKTTFNAEISSTEDIITTGEITAAKVYNAVWNDYAEWFEKADPAEDFEPGDVCIWTEKGVTRSARSYDGAVVGVVSDTYGHIIGGDDLEDMEENRKRYVPIALKGRVKCKVLGTVEIGDTIVSAPNGAGREDNAAAQGMIIGKALERSDDTGVKLITILV